VDIAAPGDSILSTIPDNDYLRLSGTSMATPMVSGIAALLKSLDIDLSGAVIKAILQSTGDEVNIETASNRRVRADRALEAVVQRKLTLVPSTITLSPDEKYDLSAWGGVPPYHFRSLDESIASVELPYS
jgi:thermitase